MKNGETWDSSVLFYGKNGVKALKKGLKRGKNERKSKLKRDIFLGKKRETVEGEKKFLSVESLYFSIEWGKIRVEKKKRGVG